MKEIMTQTSENNNTHTHTHTHTHMYVPSLQTYALSPLPSTKQSSFPCLRYPHLRTSSAEPPPRRDGLPAPRRSGWCLRCDPEGVGEGGKAD